MKTEIMYEDSEIIVIYKPSGFPAQSARVTQPDVVSEMCTYFKGQQIFLVHRLDQPVEGIMVLAKTKQAAASLSSQIVKGEMKKTYLAVVKNETGSDLVQSKEKVCLTDYMLKNPVTSKAEIVMKEKDNQKVCQATLYYLAKEQKDIYGEKLYLMEIHLITGRFHQIRAQMAHAKLPLLGDVKYGSDDAKKISKELQINDVALCAYKLSFLHPKTKKKMEYEVKPRKPIFNSYDL